MSEKKKLKVSCALCDMTGLTEAVASAYERIEVSAASVILSPEAKELAARYGIRIRAASVCEAPSGAKLSVENGTAVIGPSNRAEGTVVLMVNGCLTLRPGCEEAVRSYAHIMVNGTLFAPESLSALTAGVEVNGSVTLYPEGAILIDRNLSIDRVFLSRAEAGGVYYVDGRVCLLDETLELSSLIEKKIRIFAEDGAFVRESLLAQAAPLFDERTVISICPDGFAVVERGGELDEMLVRQMGKKLYFTGGLKLDESSAAALEQAEKIIAEGKVVVPEALRELAADRCIRCKKLEVYAGRLWENDGESRLTAGRLRRFRQGVTIVNNGVLTVEEEVEPDLAEEKILRLKNDGVVVVCSRAMKDLLEDICEGSGVVMEKKEEANGEEKGVVHIRAASYKM